MNEKRFLYADRNIQIKKINNFLSLGILVFCIVTLGIITGSVINGYRTPLYFAIVAGVMIALNITDFVLLKKQPYSLKNRYFLLWD